MTGRFGNAIDNFLIIMVAVAIVLLLVVMLGSRQSPFRQKLSKLLVQNPNAADRRQPGRDLGNRAADPRPAGIVYHHSPAAAHQ